MNGHDRAALALKEMGRWCGHDPMPGDKLQIDHLEPLRNSKIDRRTTWKNYEELWLRCRDCHEPKTREDYRKNGWRFGLE